MKTAEKLEPVMVTVPSFWVSCSGLLLDEMCGFL